MQTLMIFCILFIALLEAPLFTIIAGLSAVCLFFIDRDFTSLQMIIIEMNRLASMPVLIALPLFTFAGCLLTKSNSPTRILNFMKALTDRMPGGLPIAALCSCAFFTALTGASGVTIVALGGLLYPILKQNYSEQFSLGLITTSGSLGLLFPPSLPIILYGVIAQIDISMIFKASFVPGVILMLVLSIYAIFYSKAILKPQKKTATDNKASVAILIKYFITGMWDWIAIALILAGVYGGFATIAEVSAIVLIYIIIVECFILKEINFIKQMPVIMIESALLSGAIIVILAVSLGFTGYLVDAQAPSRIMQFLTALTDNKYIFLAGLNIFLLAVGCVMDIFSAIVIIVPIIIPVALKYGIDIFHLCVIFLMNLEIGYSTPPVGINLFISALKFEKPVIIMYRACLPYLLLLLMTLLLITYLPFLSLCLIR